MALRGNQYSDALIFFNVLGLKWAIFKCRWETWFNNIRYWHVTSPFCIYDQSFSNLAFTNAAYLLLCHDIILLVRRVARNFQWGVGGACCGRKAKLRQSLPRIKTVFVRKIRWRQKKKRKVFTQAEKRFLRTKSPQIQSQSRPFLIANASGGGSIFAFCEKKASKVLKTWYFAYSASQ